MATIPEFRKDPEGNKVLPLHVYLFERPKATGKAWRERLFWGFLRSSKYGVDTVARLPDPFYTLTFPCTASVSNREQVVLTDRPTATGYCSAWEAAYHDPQSPYYLAGSVQRSIYPLSALRAVRDMPLLPYHVLEDFTFHYSPNPLVSVYTNVITIDGRYKVYSIDLIDGKLQTDHYVPGSAQWEKGLGDTNKNTYPYTRARDTFMARIEASLLWVGRKVILKNQLEALRVRLSDFNEPRVEGDQNLPPPCNDMQPLSIPWEDLPTLHSFEMPREWVEYAEKNLDFVHGIPRKHNHEYRPLLVEALAAHLHYRRTGSKPLNYPALKVIIRYPQTGLLREVISTEIGALGCLPRDSEGQCVPIELLSRSPTLHSESFGEAVLRFMRTVKQNHQEYQTSNGHSLSFEQLLERMIGI